MSHTPTTGRRLAQSSPAAPPQRRTVQTLLAPLRLPPVRQPLPSTPAPTPAVPSPIRRQQFCASLHKRPAWAPAAAVLRASTAGPRWESAHLGSHDLAVWMMLPGSSPSNQDVFRFVLVAPADVGVPATSQRLQRLHARKRGLGGAVVFLLQPPSSSAADSNGTTMTAYQQLQDELLDTRLPILPLTSVDALPAALAAFCGQVTGPPLRSRPDDGRRPLAMLRCAVADGPPLTDAAVHRLMALASPSGSGGRASVRDVAAVVCAAAQDEHGRAQLAGAIGSAADADRMVRFWDPRL